MYDHKGRTVSATEVLDSEELDQYYRQRPSRDPRRNASGPSMMSGRFFGEGFRKADSST